LSPPSGPTEKKVMLVLKSKKDHPLTEGLLPSLPRAFSIDQLHRLTSSLLLSLPSSLA
jgi:hypothetical protein